MKADTGIVMWCCQNLKDTIWKQFTTRRSNSYYHTVVLSEPQRYNLKAIHNGTSRGIFRWVGVVRTSKIQFESNSQHGDNGDVVDSWCCQNLKDTIWKQFTTACASSKSFGTVLSEPQRYNLKAIHNIKLVDVGIASGVVRTSKIQFESNSQLSIQFLLLIARCCQNLKDTIWKQFTTLEKELFKIKLVLSEPQRYNLKAIHNMPEIRLRLKQGVVRTSKIQFESNSQRKSFHRAHSGGVVRTSKIQFESNSQPSGLGFPRLRRCCQNLKDTIWKQFTTKEAIPVSWYGVLSEPQRYNLKAIHNFHCTSQIRIWGVVRTSKIQFESNSQQL